MEIIFDKIFRALGYLFIAGIVYFAWKTASDNAEGGKYKTVLWKGFLLCAGIALFASFTLGNPTCEEQSDPVYGGCEQYADDGFEPTIKQRVAHFAYYMTLLYIPVVIGALKKR
ncbi:MAG: hypothetical protein A3H02_02450 [Candidatus Niyogibacteria bacterium RIFCSPLOWO2_12_FULL_41_13]|uniref:Uncharacterized protein n=1 Tax=Candidatus Niyogibacteria bacterium RIFCSPLOWO2_12_FULL_41_13 TaxID=1801726 RepID=A0A1G2F0H0_9BACT|nr:MAG: hypothetical protein A3H02_02450 [Candidatus Niyogibacteria bacterium RIFCSPLOWO2_12_FULL_41_13]